MMRLVQHWRAGSFADFDHPANRLRFTSRRRYRNDRGAAAVEFALVVIPLVVIVFGIIQFGITFGQILALNNASRQGARSGVVALNPCGTIMEQVRQGTSGAIAMSYPLTVTATGAGVCAGQIAEDGGITYTTGTLNTVVCPPGSTSQSLEVRTESTPTIVIPFVTSSDRTIAGNGVFQCEIG